MKTFGRMMVSFMVVMALYFGTMGAISSLFSDGAHTLDYMSVSWAALLWAVVLHTVVKSGQEQNSSS